MCGQEVEVKQRSLIILAIGLIVLGSVGFFGALAVTNWSSDSELGSTTGPRAGPGTGPNRGPGSGMGRGGEAGAVDAMFIEQMVPHHQDAIDMAEMAITSAEHPEVVELAESIKESQSAENEQMREWYSEWFDAEVPDVGGRGMRGPMMGAETDLDRLRDAEDFDKEFIEQMVPHHQMAIMMAQMARRSTNRPEMQQLTDSIIETQSREIEDMRRWYREWYGN